MRSSEGVPIFRIKWGKKLHESFRKYSMYVNISVLNLGNEAYSNETNFEWKY